MKSYLPQHSRREKTILRFCPYTENIDKKKPVFWHTLHTVMLVDKTPKNVKRPLKVYNAQKMKFFIKDFFVDATKSAGNCIVRFFSHFCISALI